jgi:membrane-associated protease RseP (regulator of RpoE activity)
LKRRFELLGFTPYIREEDNTVTLNAAPVVLDPAPSRWIINLVLLLATILSLLWVGAAGETDGMPGLGELWRGLPYCLSLMVILGAHELGHYFAARYHNVPVSLPYFIPLPISLFGTLGAVIVSKAPTTNKRALLDIGAAGPLAGLVFAIPILIYGLSISPIQPLPPPGQGFLEGNSIFYAFAKLAVKGQFLPSGTEDVLLSQVAWAGWVGLLVTGINLIPVGQLDGGRIAYALFGQNARKLYWPVLIAMVVLSIATMTATWVVLLILLFFFGRLYEEPLDDVTPLDGRRQALAIASLLIFVLVFVPIPIRQL